MAIGYDLYNDPANPYLPSDATDSGPGSWGNWQLPVGQPQAGNGIDSLSGGLTPMQWYQQNNAGGVTGYRGPDANQGGLTLGQLANVGQQQPNMGVSQPNQFGSPQSFADYFSSRGVTPFSGSVDYWAQKWPELNARGAQLGNPNYAMQRLQYADEFLPGGPSTSPFYEAPQQQSTSSVQQMQPTSSSLTPGQGSVMTPTWTAMLNNSSQYHKGGIGSQNIDDGIQTFGSKPMTLAQLASMGR